MISLDAALRVEGIPALGLWGLVIDIFHPIKEAEPEVAESVTSRGVNRPHASQAMAENATPASYIICECLAAVDFVPPNLPEPNGRPILVLLEDNDLVIKVCIKGRNPTHRHCPRIHRVNIDATYERIREDLGSYMRRLSTEYHMAEISTGGVYQANLGWYVRVCANQK